MGKVSNKSSCKSQEGFFTSPHKLIHIQGNIISVPTWVQFYGINNYGELIFYDIEPSGNYGGISKDYYSQEYKPDLMVNEHFLREYKNTKGRVTPIDVLDWDENVPFNQLKVSDKGFSETKKVKYLDVVNLEIPSHCKYVAIDAEGKVIAFVVKPDLTERGWETKTAGRTYKIMDLYLNGVNWRKTLVKV